MTSLSGRFRHQSFHFMRFASNGDRFNDSKAYMSRNPNKLLHRRSQQVYLRVRQLMRRRACFERVSHSLWHVFVDTLAHFLRLIKFICEKQGSSRCSYARRQFIASCLFLRFVNCDIGKLIPSDMRQAQSTCCERFLPLVWRWETETRQLRLPLNSEHNENCTKSVIAHDTKNGKWNYGDFILFYFDSFRWFLFFHRRSRSTIIVSFLMFAETWLLLFCLLLSSK